MAKAIIRDRGEVERLYKLHKSYSKVGQILKLSRQRVFQLLKDSKDRDVHKIRNTKRQANYTPFCIVCKREFGKEIKYNAKGLCKGCEQYKRNSAKRTPKGYFRRISYPDTCLGCGADTTDDKNRSRGYDAIPNFV